MDRRKRGSPAQAGTIARASRWGSTERRWQTTSPVPSPPTDRTSMLVIEANEISRCLQKDYVFAKVEAVATEGGAEGKGDGEEEREGTRPEGGASPHADGSPSPPGEADRVKVTHKKYGLSCHWSIPKLKERLMKMRKLIYASDAEGSSLGAEAVFFDPSDEWGKDTVTSSSYASDVTNGDGDDSLESALKALKEDVATANRATETQDRVPIIRATESPRDHDKRESLSLALQRRSGVSSSAPWSRNRTRGSLVKSSSVDTPSAAEPSVAPKTTSTTRTRYPASASSARRNSPKLLNGASRRPKGASDLSLDLNLLNSNSDEDSEAKDVATNRRDRKVISERGPLRRVKSSSDSHGRTDSGTRRRSREKPETTPALVSSQLSPSDDAPSRRPSAFTPVKQSPLPSESQWFSVTASDRESVSRQPSVSVERTSRGGAAREAKDNEAPSVSVRTPKSGAATERTPLSNGRARRSREAGSLSARGHRSTSRDHDDSRASEPASLSNDRNSPSRDKRGSDVSRESRAKSGGVARTTYEKRGETDSSRYGRTTHSGLSAERSGVSTGGSTGLSTGGSTGSELPSQSEFVQTQSKTRNDVTKGLPDKYFALSSHSPENDSESPRKPTSRNSSLTHTPQTTVTRSSSTRRRGVDASSQTSSRPDPQKATMLTLCKEMVGLTLQRLKGVTPRETMVDKMLFSCESIKVAVINILEAFTQAQANGESPAVFADCELMRITSMQLVASLELLVSRASLWASQGASTGESRASDLHEGIHKAVRNLASELLLFLQGCEDDKDSLAQDATARILDLLYELVRHCGDLALTSDMSPISLLDPDPASLDSLTSLPDKSDEDLVRIRPQSDIKQAFLEGCDVSFDRSLQSLITPVTEGEATAEKMAAADKRGGESEVFKHVYIVAATCKLLIIRCQQLQVELNAQMKAEDDVTSLQENYFYRYFRRCHAVMSRVATHVDSVTLLMQAAEAFCDGDADGNTLRKICRCSELTQRAALKVVAASNNDAGTDQTAAGGLSSSRDPLLQQSLMSLNGISTSSVTSRSMSSLPNVPRVSTILAPDQCQQIQSAGEEVRLATLKLMEVAHTHLTLNYRTSSREVKVKRMLPVTPRVTWPVSRAQSATAADIRRHSLTPRQTGDRHKSNIK